MRFSSHVVLNGKTATGMPVPEEVVAALGSGKRPRVYVTVRQHTYRSTVAPMGGAYWLPLSAENRTAAGVVAGEDVEVELELDSDPRTVDVPDDLVTALGKNASAAAAFEALSYSNKRRHVLSVEGAKTEATRIRRITKVVDSLSAAES